MNISSTRMAVIAALTGNLLIAITKFVAAIWTGSSAMLSEGFHSLVDTSNQALLLYGQKRAERPPDRQHPLGHGRELYFWSFVVTVLIFSLGAGLALYEGVHHVMSPTASTSPMVNYIVLGLSFLFEGAPGASHSRTSPGPKAMRASGTRSAAARTRRPSSCWWRTAPR
jgi:cation diffusion facilitator family transporter